MLFLCLGISTWGSSYVGWIFFAHLPFQSFSESFYFFCSYYFCCFLCFLPFFSVSFQIFTSIYSSLHTCNLFFILKLCCLFLQFLSWVQSTHCISFALLIFVFRFLIYDSNVLIYKWFLTYVQFVMQCVLSVSSILEKGRLLNSYQSYMDLVWLIFNFSYSWALCVHSL